MKNNRNLKRENENTIPFRLFEEEIRDYAVKIENLIIESGKGEINQVYKIALIKLLVDSVVNSFIDDESVREIGTPTFDEVMEVMMDWLEDNAKITIKKVDKDWKPFEKHNKK